MNFVKHLSKPIVYRRLLVSGFLVFGTGVLLVSIPITFLGVIVVALSKYGMRKEHKEKLRTAEQKFTFRK